MKCWTVKELLVDYLERELPEPERELIKEHLASCESCRRECADTGGFLEAIRTRDELPAGIPAGGAYNATLFGKLHDRIRRPLTGFASAFNAGLNVKVAAAAVLLIGLFVFAYVMKLSFRTDAKLYDENYSPQSVARSTGAATAAGTAVAPSMASAVVPSVADKTAGANKKAARTTGRRGKANASVRRGIAVQQVQYAASSSAGESPDGGFQRSSTTVAPDVEMVDYTPGTTHLYRQSVHKSVEDIPVLTETEQSDLLAKMLNADYL